MDIRELAMMFESLGDNCEFGLFQRRCGAEPLGLFRLNWSTLDSILRVFSNNFEDIGNPEKIEIWPDPKTCEFFVKMSDYGFSYHTGQYATEVSAADVFQQQIKTQRFLKRKLLDDLSCGEKIFVRKGSDSSRLAEAEKLYAAIRKHGPGTLLWVVPEDEMHPRGTVQVIGEGFLQGYIDRFAPYLAAPDLSPSWIEVCRGAYGLASARAPVGTAIRHIERRETTNLIRRIHLESTASWCGLWVAPTASCKPADLKCPPEVQSCSVAEYMLVSDTTPDIGTIMLCKIPDGLLQETPYVASTYVFIPNDANLICTDLIVAGVPGICAYKANISVRNEWQRIWTHVRLPSGRSDVAVGLFVVGRSGTRVYSTGWQLELGYRPTSYVSSNAGILPQLSKLEEPRFDMQMKTLMREN